MNIKNKCIDPVDPAENGLRIGGVKIIVHEITGDLEPSQKRLNRMVA